MKLSLTNRIILVAWIVVDFDEKDEHRDVDDARVEVGHIEGGAQAADERVRPYDGCHHHCGQLHAQTFHQIRHYRSATCRTKCKVKKR